MSKKDKKRIAELERQQSILSATIRVMREEHDYLSRCYNEDKFGQDSTPKSEPKQPETAKDSPPMDGAIHDKTKCVAYEQGEEVLNKSTFDWLKQTRPKQDKTKCAGCQNIENILNKFTLNNPKQTEPKQGSDGEDSPTFGKCRGGFINGKFVKSDADEFDTKLRELQELPLKSEVKEAVRGEEKQGGIEQPQWCIYNTKNNSLVLISYGANCRYSSRQDAENAIYRLHNSGHISGKFHHYDAVLVIEMIKRMEAKEAQSDQRKTENDSKKQGEKQQFWIVQTNPMKLERFNSYYLNTVNNDGLVQHTPDPNEAMKFYTDYGAADFIIGLISDSPDRYESKDFRLCTIDNLGVVTPQN